MYKVNIILIMQNKKPKQYDYRVTHTKYKSYN